MIISPHHGPVSPLWKIPLPRVADPFILFTKGVTAGDSTAELGSGTVQTHR